jgi:predicted nucleic acid-binding protein
MSERDIFIEALQIEEPAQRQAYLDQACREIDQLLARFQHEPVASGDSTRALTWLRKYYHSRGVGFHDCLLGAAAVRRKIPLATMNEKHFKALPGVKVVRPYGALGRPE